MVHTFSLNGYKIALDVNTGSINVLDDIVFEILDGFGELPGKQDVTAFLNHKYASSEIEEAYDEIVKLKDEGVLFSEDFDEEKVLKTVHRDMGIKALCLHVAHDCNLRCKYCFGSQGSYNTQKSLMPFEVAKRATDFLINNSGNKRKIEIDFFGGEPLLNYEVIKRAVEYGREAARKHGKEFHYTVTTNGVLLDDEKINFINKEMDNVVISMDGRKKIHDSMRYDGNKKGTYDKTLPNAMKLVEKRGDKNYFIRGTYTAENLDFSEDVMHLTNLGFKEISIEPVMGKGQEFNIREEHLDTIYNEYKKLAKEYIENRKSDDPYRFYHFSIDIYEGPCIYKRIRACGAGFEYFAVSPEGDIYPCHQFVGKREFKIGNICSGISNNKLKKTFMDNNVFRKEECKNCWAKFLCSGGCHANAYFTNGDISKPDEISCKLQKKRIECAIMIEVAKALE